MWMYTYQNTNAPWKWHKKYINENKQGLSNIKYIIDRELTIVFRKGKYYIISAPVVCLLLQIWWWSMKDEEGRSFTWYLHLLEINIIWRGPGDSMS